MPSPTVDSLLLWCVPCVILLLCHRFVFLRVRNAYAMFYVLLCHRFVFLRVHNAYAMYYVLRIATDLCSLGFTTHTSCHVGVSTGITIYVLMYTHSRSMNQLCHLLSIFILTLSMFSFSGKHRTTSASDGRISSDHGHGTSLPLQVTVL